MGELADQLSVDDKGVLEFFAQRLSDVAGPRVDRTQLIYNASVLAHYAQVSTQTGLEMATPSNLTAVFDHFVYDTSLYHDSEMMETAGAQCLLFAGFFEDQMRRRHNINWYSKLGASFFRQASAQEKTQAKAVFLIEISLQFEPWRQRHARLSRELRDSPYLLFKPPFPPS